MFLSKAFLVLTVILASVLVEAQDKASIPFLNLQQIMSNLNFTPYYDLKPMQRVKVAIFDRGFDGFEKVIGKNLPADTKYSEGCLTTYDGGKEMTPPGCYPRDKSDATDHGLYMAELIYDLMTNQGQAPQFAPEIYLYQVNSFSNFEKAVQNSIDEKVQIVSYSEVRDTGLTFDGQGEWNEIINRAIKKGIVWVNAAGNTAQLTFNSYIRTNDDGYVILPDLNNTLQVTCQNTVCRGAIVLLWNDFKNVPDAGTDKDLNLALLNSSGSVVVQSSLRQISDRSQGGEGTSLNPREKIEFNLNQGNYYIKVKNHSNNFTTTDHLRIIIESDDLIANHFDMEESLLSPADNPNVVTVGALGFNQSSLSNSLKKPENLIESTLYLTGDIKAQGGSNSAAMVTAGYGLLLDVVPSLDEKTLLGLTSHPFDYSGGRYTETKLDLNSPSQSNLATPKMNSAFRLPSF